MAEHKHDVDDLMSMFNEYRQAKSGLLQEWRLIRSLYRGRFWQVFKKHMKEYTITPEWNYFEYVIQAYSNSIYSGAFIGTLTPREEIHSEEIRMLNAFIAYEWNRWGMKNKFLHLGENGELYNLGAVRADWDAKRKTVKLEALSSDEVYFDPGVDDYREGAAIFIERAVNVNKLKKNSNYEKAVENWHKKNKDRIQNKTRNNRIALNETQETTKNETVSLIECFIRNENGELDQVHILNEEEIIYEKTDMPLQRYPVVAYMPTRPDGGPYGNPKLVKIFNTVVALNLLDSMEATQPYRILNRVRFVDVRGRLDMRAYADYGNTPGASFETYGDPRNIVYYEEVQTIPDQSVLKQRLENSIFQVTGVDPYYKGRMTNSLQTTGATQAMQARVTMLTDNTRITQLEETTEELTRVILDLYFQYAGDHTYKIPQLSANGTNKVVGTHNLNFNKLRREAVRYDYFLNASTLLPMNQANLFESAKALYEMQGQYGFKKRVITEKDLIRFSDFPQKDLFLQRMEKEEQEGIAEKLIADLTNFASIFTRLLGQGLTEEQAAQEAISILIEEKNAMEQDPSIGQGFQ